MVVSRDSSVNQNMTNEKQHHTTVASTYFIKVLPNTSITTNPTMTENPSPMYWGDPYLREVSPLLQVEKGGGNTKVVFRSS